jgi:CRISPR-associated endoribonuclease Cas6
VSSWLDVEHHAPCKPHATTPLRRDGHHVSLDIGLLDDHLVTRLGDSARTGTRVRFGRQHTTVVGLTLVEAQPWAQLLTDSGCRAWSLSFITPTTFRHDDRYSPWPDPITVVTGLHRRLSVFAPQAPDLPTLRRDHLWVCDVDGSSESLVLNGRAVSGFVGHIRYALAADAPGGAVIDAALRMSRYCGVGAHTTHGLGVTLVEPLARAA